MRVPLHSSTSLVWPTEPFFSIPTSALRSRLADACRALTVSQLCSRSLADIGQDRQRRGRGLRGLSWGQKAGRSVCKITVLFCIFLPHPAGEDRPQCYLTSVLKLRLTCSVSDLSLSLNGPAAHMVQSSHWHFPTGPPAVGLRLLADGTLAPLKRTLDLVFRGGQTLELSRSVSHHKAATNHLSSRAKHRLPRAQFLIWVLHLWGSPGLLGIPFLDLCLASGLFAVAGVPSTV